VTSSNGWDTNFDDLVHAEEAAHAIRRRVRHADLQRVVFRAAAVLRQTNDAVALVGAQRRDVHAGVGRHHTERQLIDVALPLEVQPAPADVTSATSARVSADPGWPTIATSLTADRSASRAPSACPNPDELRELQHLVEGNAEDEFDVGLCGLIEQRRQDQTNASGSVAER
jgi:hypothetical protein